MRDVPVDTNSSNYVRSLTSSLPVLLVLCQRDNFTLGLYYFLRGLAYFEEHLRNRRLFQNASLTLDSMIEFSRLVYNVMTEVLPEYEDLAQEYDNEELWSAVSILIGKLASAFEHITSSLERMWKALEANFPLDKDTFGSRFSCTENSLITNIRKMINKTTNRDLLSNFSELLVMDILECGFRLIWSCRALANGNKVWNFKMHQLLNADTQKVVHDLSMYRAQCEDAVRGCEDSFKVYFSEIDRLCMELEGIPITMETRFSAEYNLHSNTLSVISIVDNVSKILERIRQESLNLLREKSEEKANASNVVSQLETMHAELENKLSSLMTHTKLELQLLSKVVNSSSIPAETTAHKPYREEDQAELDADENEDGVLGSKTDIGVLSYETSGKDDIHDYSSVEVLDEFFEIVTEQEDSEGVSNQQENETGVEEVKQAHQVVLEQLKTVLKPRQLAMKTREVEAYKRVYGQLPSHSVEEEVHVVPSKKKDERQALLQELLQQRQKAEESADVFQDESDSESSSEPDLFSTDFMSRLDKTLQFKTFGSSD
ncbi:unnamed protein product [Allacma fusca]|uniref:Uncharacterized protein n=1 Tax=Allacma fusca TaxID=39272 RepID=A0A8J2PRK7_9HEXA|nr:unnamed protein product [Allacma fusca]